MSGVVGCAMAVPGGARQSSLIKVGIAAGGAAEFGLSEWAFG
jgi:hypothetical protein